MTSIPFDDIPVCDNMQTIAFYNVENLFDYSHSRYTNDYDFLPTSAKRWTPKRYENKLRKLGFAISNIGRRETGKHPAVVGLAEVENKAVIKDLLQSNHLKDYPYKFVHYESLDERGIDVALIYDASVFKLLYSETFKVLLTNTDGTPDFTRDILLVNGLLNGEEITFIVNHWASRYEGVKESEPKRLYCSDKVAKIIEELRNDNANAKIMVMGDFNDAPNNKSVKNLVLANGLYNPMEVLQSFGRGTTIHGKKWFTFDQILLSNNFLEQSDSVFKFYKANIFDEDFLKLFNGPFKGAPFRTYVGKKYHGGFSDHFPVYVVLER